MGKYGNEATDKRLISKIYNQLLWLNIKKQTTQSETIGEDLKDFLQRYTESQKDSTSLIIEMQIKTTVKYHLHQSEWQTSKSLQTINAWEGVEERPPILLLGI